MVDGHRGLLPRHEVPLGEAWAANSVNTVAFRHHGILSHGNLQAAAFYRDHDSLCVVRRDLNTGAIEVASIAGVYNLADAHNSISLGMDRRCNLHICYDQHGKALQYRRTRTPFGIADWTEELPMTGMHERNMTYQPS